MWELALAAKDCIASTITSGTLSLIALFHKLRDKDNLLLQIPNLNINNYEIKRSSSIKFTGILVDENLTWVDPSYNSGWKQTVQKRRIIT